MAGPRLRTLLRAASVALLLVAGAPACGGDDEAGSPGGVASAADGLDAIGGPDLRSGSLSPSDGVVEVDVSDGEVAVLVWVRAADPDDEVYLEALTDPAGESMVGAVVERAGLGEHAVLLVGPDGGPPRPGRHVLEYSGAGIEAAGFVGRSGTADADLLVDLQVLDGTEDGVDDGERAEVDRAISSVASTLLDGTGVGLGRIRWLDAPDDLVDAHATLELPSEGDDAAMRRLCEMATDVEPARAVTLVVVDEVFDPDLDDGETEGNAGAIPGAVLLPGARTGCVAVAAAGERPLRERGAVVWHEVGHLLGLAHTSEAQGDSFDPLDDTPRCTLGDDADGDGHLDEEECADLDGTNFMFHDTDSLGISPQQVAVLRRNPVLRPAGG